MKADFIEGVYQTVAAIPYGQVTTYGMVAQLAGYPNYPRMVGRVLREKPEGIELPCHRVVNSNGRPAPGWPEQTAMLKAEGITFKPNGCVDLKKYGWDIEMTEAD